MKDELIDAIARLDETSSINQVKDMLQQGINPVDIMRWSQEGVKLVGERYSFGIYYLSDLIMSSEILKEIFYMLSPGIELEYIEQQEKEEIIVGTIQGDIHDLGKDILIFTLRSAGFKVHDLGVDVPAEKFIKKIQETGARIIGVSVLLNFCFNEIKKLNELLTESGLRNKVKVIVGGYPVNQAVNEFVGADYYSNDALEALSIIKNIAASFKKDFSWQQY